MPNTEAPGRKTVTSDPDRGVAVNSGTDPQRPGKPARPTPDPAPDKSTPADDSRVAPRPSASRNEDVEGGGNEPDDPL
jgi:hypothetical protein